MPAAMTYTSLLEDIKNYAEREDDPFLAQRERFVMMAENRLAKEVRGLGVMQFVQSTLTTGNPIIAKPSRWRENVSFTITTVGGMKIALQPRSIQYCRSFWPDSADVGVPRYYADYDFEHFYLAGTPDADLAFELTYYERPEPLSDLNLTNWYTQYSPDTLLYACLLEAQPWLKLDGRTAQFQALYDRSLQMLGNESMRRMTDNTQTRREA
jgi:hypothetical protein